jgi:hypothetical protein
MFKKYFVYFAAIAIATFTFSCQSENEEELYGNKNTTPVDSLTGQIAYFPFNQTLADKKGNVFSNLNKPAVYTDGVAQSENSALILDGTQYFLIDLGRTFDSISVVFWFKNDNDINSGYLPYIIDYGFGYSSARLDLDAVSSATYMYITSDTMSYPDKEDVPASSRINTRNGWTLFYFECTQGHTQTIVKFEYPVLGALTVASTSEVPQGSSAATQILTIGKGSDFSGSYSLLKGAIDELRIYRGFLSNRQLSAIYSENEE